MEDRRDFIKTMAVGSVGLTVGETAFGFSAKSYKNIIGANEKIRVATIGVNSRGNGMSGTFAKQKNAEVVCVCDVDEKGHHKGHQNHHGNESDQHTQVGKRLPQSY